MDLVLAGDDVTAVIARSFPRCYKFLNGARPATRRAGE